MTRAHRDKVLELAPRQLRKSFTLHEAAHLIEACDVQTVAELSEFRPLLSGYQHNEIADPIGHSADFFNAVGTDIAALLPPILDLCRSSS
jgi:protein-tyrosine phosphatase